VNGEGGLLTIDEGRINGDQQADGV
jgi:hypothetical protein